MKEIKAIFRPFKYMDVIEGLLTIDNLPGVTVSEIKGFGKQRGKGAVDSTADDTAQLVEKIKLEVVVHNEMVETVVNIMQRCAHTGNPGDGKIFIYDVEETVKIRTNERGEEAI